MPSNLANLAKAVPGLNAQAQSKAQAAANVQLQQQLGAAPSTTNVTAGAQQLAAQHAGQQGQIAAQGQAAQQQQLAQLGQQGLQQQQQTGQLDLARQEMDQKGQLVKEGLSEKQKLNEADISSRKRMSQSSIQSAQRLQKIGLDYDERLHLLSDQQTKDLSRIGRDIKTKIFDARMTFDRDEMGRKFTNERQLADYTLANSKNEQEARERLQTMQQHSQRKVQMMEFAYKKISQALTQSMKKSESQKDFLQQKKLAQMKQDMEKRIADAKSKANNKAAMIGAASTIAGVVGTIYGSPAGGVAASAGVTMIGSQM